MEEEEYDNTKSNNNLSKADLNKDIMMKYTKSEPDFFNLSYITNLNNTYQ